jgi:diacylglycerol kinase family enzyme
VLPAGNKPSPGVQIRCTLLPVQIRLVVNPHASTTTPERRRAVESVLADRHDVSVVVTERRDHATELTRAAVADGVDAVAVLGGDGTLNEVANALVGTRLRLFALPGGGTNVFCRTLGLPDDPVAAATELLDAHDRGSVRRIGVGTIDGTGLAGRDHRHFVFHTGVGWDAAVVAVVERHSRWKRRLGHALFVYAGVRTFFGTYDRRRPHFRLELDDGTKVHDAFFAIVMNSDPYTFVGHRPFVVDPSNSAATPFTVVALRSMRIRHFLAVMTDALRGKGLHERPTLVLRRDVSGVTVRRTTSLPYQVDGDHLGDAAELRMSYRPDALTVVVPTPTT